MIISIMGTILTTVNAQDTDDYLQKTIQKDYPISVSGNKARLPTTAKFKYTLDDEGLATMKLTATSSLTDLNRILQPSLAQSINKNDKCGENISVNHARIEQVTNGKAQIRVELRYELWGCAFGGNGKIGSQSGSIWLNVTPSMSRNKIQFNLDVTRIKAGGVLGSLVENSGSVRRKIIEMIQEKIPQSIQASLSSDLKDFDEVKVNSCKFIPGPGFYIEGVIISDFSIFEKKIFEQIHN